MKRLQQLDGIRGIAILLVLVWHYLGLQWIVQAGSLPAYFKLGMNLSWSGVDLFFILSGFLITGILLDQAGSPRFFSTFYLRRVCRIFPLYFLLLAVFVLLGSTSYFKGPSYQWVFSNPMPLWSYVTFCQNFFMGARSSFGADGLAITWSLAVEEQFYLVVPLLVYLLPRRILGVVFVLAILSAPLLRWFYPGFHDYVYAPWRSDSLFLGALLALLFRWPPFLPALTKQWRLLSGVTLFFLLGMAFLSWRPLIGPFDHLWIGLFYTLLMALALTEKQVHLDRFLRAPILRWFGKLSFGIYMVHQGISGILHGLFRGSYPQMRTFSDAGITLLALVLTLAAAMLSYRFLESPILRWGHRFQYGPKLANR